MVEHGEPEHGAQHAEGAETTAREDAVMTGESYDDVVLAEPYTRSRFLKEAAVAVGILAVGLPLVLVLAPDGRPAPEAPLAQSSVSASPTPSPTPTQTQAPLDDRPVLLVTGDLDASTADSVAQQTANAATSTGSASVVVGKGYTSVQPSLATLVVQAVPTPELAMVLVQAGASDTSGPAGSARVGALRVVQRLRQAVSGSTSLTLVGPVPDGEPTPALLRVRDEVLDAAKRSSVHFVDPVELGLTKGQADLPTRLGAAAATFINRI